MTDEKRPSGGPDHLVLAISIALVFFAVGGMYSCSKEKGKREDVLRAREAADRDYEARRVAAAPAAPAPVPVLSPCFSATSHLCRGVQLFGGSDCDGEMGTVLGGNERYVTDDGRRIRGLKVQAPNGDIRWMDREVVIRKLFVRRDDPALEPCVWKTYVR